YATWVSSRVASLSLPAAGKQSVGAARPLMAASYRQHLRKQLAIGGDGLATMDGGHPLPIGESPSGPFDNGLDGGGIPQAHAGVDHHVPSPQGHHHVAVGVPPGPHEPRFLLQFEKL